MATRAAAWDGQPGPRQDHAARAGHWPVLLDAGRLISQRLQLLGSPAGMPGLGAQQRRDDRLGYGIGMVPRCARVWL